MDHSSYVLALAREDEIRSIVRRPEQQQARLRRQRRRARRPGRAGR